MSRWGRGRSGSVAVPLDSALFRENSNCPTAARSAGTVGKWGITSFTSIRSAPYAYANNVVKKSVQDQNSPLTVPAVETEQPPPKPKKFFKSRNAEPYPPVPQITYAPPVSAAPLSPEHTSHSRERKNKKSRIYNRDSSSPEIPWRGSSEKSKTKKSVATKAAKKVDGLDPNLQPPNKRYLVRNRDKVINYAEDGSNSPVPDFSRYDQPPAPKPSTQVYTPEMPSPKVPSPKASPVISSPISTKMDAASPSTSKDSNEERKPPPIVLRISKGTSRIVSTDSNEGFTSPGSDRHSSLDTHSDIGTELIKKSPAMESICSPKHEGLKITIKCTGLAESKKEKKKDKKEHRAHKRHHKNSDDEPLKKPSSSPHPGSDAYDLYKTLASPTSSSYDFEKDKTKPVDDIESQLAKLDSTGPPLKSPRLEANEPQPEPKPPETSGRARRNRPNINYSENDDYLDAITKSKGAAPPKLIIKTVGDLKRETRKGKKRLELSVAEAPVVANSLKDNVVEEPGSQVDDSDLIGILSGSDTSKKEETYKKPHKKQKHRHMKHLSPEKDSVPAEVNDNEHQSVPESDNIEPSLDANDEMHEDGSTEPTNENQNYLQANTQSSDSAYNSCPNDNFEDDSHKNLQDDVFKPPMLNNDNHLDDKPSVKLVITKKKGSIFKSKSLVNDNPSPLPARKRRHLYRHEWANDKGNETPRPEPQGTPEASPSPVAEVSEELTKVTKYRAPDPIIDDPAEAVKPYTSVKCSKEAKEYYTVVRNVKKAHQIQEIGEFQEFNDDVEYLLDTLQDNNPISTRCLSAITLASKCTAPAFRMHLRAHGTVQKFFSALHDATNDQSLGLCTATVMFVLSQDRLNMDLDRESLELMLNLLESDASHKNALDDCGLTSAQLAKTQDRVRELCAEIKSQGKAQHLDLENITVGHLAMETLLSLTSKRAGEWFKEELRNLGGVDHIVRTIHDCASRLETPAASWTGPDIDVLRKADRCMRVLENVTQQNEDNQLYLVNGGHGCAATVVGLLRRCAGEASLNRALRTALLDAALPAIKVLVNLSHTFRSNEVSIGAQVVGDQPSLMEICLIILNNHGNFISEDRNFEFSVCVLLLLINLVQNSDVNTQRLLSVRIRVDHDEDIISRSLPALDLIVDLFYKREDLARRAEENTDALLDGEKESGDSDKNKKQSQDDIDETVAKLLSRAGTHMEHTMVGAYIALLLGHMAVVSPAHAAAVRARVPTYAPLLPTLNKYYTFLSLTASAEAPIVAHVKATHRIIQFMERSDKEAEAEAPAPAPPSPARPYPGHYYRGSPSDLPQDMSLTSMNHYHHYSNSSSDRMSSSMEADAYR